MKNCCLLFLTMCIFFCTYANVSAIDCNMNLTEHSNFQDVIVLLKCLDSKIQNLEKEVREIKGENYSLKDSSKSLLENEYISVYGFKLFKEAKGIMLSFIVINKSSDDIYLSIADGKVIIRDERGHAFTQYSYDGLERCLDNNTNKKDYSTLNPGVPNPVSLFFKTEEFHGDEVSFKVTFQHLKDGKIVFYSFARSRAILEK